MSNSYSSVVVYGWTGDVRLSRICDLLGLQLGVRGEKHIARAQLFRIMYRNIKKRRAKLWQLTRVSKSSPAFEGNRILPSGGGCVNHGQ
jgi:hypothetical protein